MPEAVTALASPDAAPRPTTARKTSSSEGSDSSTEIPSPPLCPMAAPTASGLQAAASTRTWSPAPKGSAARTPGSARSASAPAERLRPRTRSTRSGTQVRLSAAGVSSATSFPSTMRPMRRQYSASSR